jgi:hypothetical protein
MFPGGNPEPVDFPEPGRVAQGPDGQKHMEIYSGIIRVMSNAKDNFGRFRQTNGACPEMYAARKQY